MADSDNTTTRPFVTRRRVLAGTAIAIVRVKGNEFVSSAPETNQSVDPAVAVWQKWQAAHDHTEWLCRQQQCLERKLVETVGFPSANVLLRDGESVTTHSLEALHEVTGDAAVRAKAEADLAAHQARWDAADREIGYSTTLLAECEAGDRVEQLLEMLSETPAASLAGVTAKLDAVLREGQVSEGCAEFPWPQIRSVFEDISRIGQQTASSRMVPNGRS